YPVLVTITNAAGDPAFVTSTASVTDLLAASGTRFTAAQKVMTGPVVVATLTDSGSLLNPSAYVGSIDWGDGFPVDPATFTPAPDGSLMVTGSHRYWGLGDHTVRVKRGDPASGTEVSVTSTATVLPPVLAATGVTLETTEGSPLGNSVVATFTDTAADPGPFQVSIDWADNTPLDTTGTVTGS